MNPCDLFSFKVKLALCIFAATDVFALGGAGATCNPSTPGWGTCPLDPVPFEASITQTIQVPGGNYDTPYQAGQANTRYVLQGDIMANGTAIEVKANWVIVDLNGHTITYNQTVPGEGVTIGSYNLHHIAVRNGSILQGAAMSEGDQYGRGNNPVSTYNTILGGNRSVNNLHISHLYVRLGGRDVGGIICAGDNGLYEQNTIEDTFEFGTLKNRHQGTEALTGSKGINANGNVYRNNTIIHSRHKGIVTGNNAEVYGNHISLRSIATNANGVSFYQGQNITIRDNTIIGRGEHPIGIGVGGGSGAKNYQIFNNLIDVMITALGEEYGGQYDNNPNATYIGNSASGIRVTWGGDNINVFDNQITAHTHTRYEGTYSPTGAAAFIDGGGKGLFIGAYPGESSTFSNNTISVTGDGTYTYGVTCSHSFSDGLFVIGNTITSSLYNIVVGDDYGPSNGFPLFQGNILIKSGSSDAYRTLISTYNGGNTSDFGQTRNSTARFIDNQYQNGASETPFPLLPGNGGITDVYFGTYSEANGYLYSKRLHDNNNNSSTLITDTFDPMIRLDYRHPQETPNQPPVLSPVGNRTVPAGQTVEFVVEATDPDGDSLEWSANGAG